MPFFIPLVGLILWMIWKNDRPRDAGHGRSASRDKTEPIFEQMFYYGGGGRPAPADGNATADAGRAAFRQHGGTISCTNRRCVMTQAVAYSNFRANLKTYMRRVNEDADTLLVTNADPEDNVVVMSADDYDSLMETLRVYQNPYLSDKVTRGMAQVRQGQTMAHDLVEAGA